MSSTERAPEPTMEEILSSIRRIITDDETDETRAANAAPEAEQASEAQQVNESAERDGEADSQIIDDIARVLSGGAPAAEVDEEEDILDLTSELGGLELVEEVEAVEEVEVVEEIELLEDVAPAPEFMAEAAEPIAAAPASPPVEELAQQAAAPQMEAPEPPAPQPSASEEAASALERAIAALKAGQVPTSTSPQAEPFQFQTAPQPEAMSTPEFMPEAVAEPAPEFVAEPVPMAIPMEAPEPEPETHPEAEPSFDAQPDSAPTLELMTEPEPLAEEMVGSEFEVTVTEMEELVELEAAEEEPETTPFWPHHSKYISDWDETLPYAL